MSLDSHRRTLVSACVLFLVVTAVLVLPLPAQSAQPTPFQIGLQQGSCTLPANEIVAENCLPGTPASVWDVTGAGDLSIQGFATKISVNRGETVEFKIDTTATAYTIPIYRLGYYSGAGARLVDTIQPTAVTNQPGCDFYPENNNLLDCGNWTVSASWGVPADATSGVYIARPTRTDNSGASHIVFIVRDDASTSDLIFQTSDTTWQSYNPYGGYNAYGSGGATMAEKLSYNRPFTLRGAELENWLFNAEYPMIRWLERNGYDVSYMAAVDTERNAGLIDNHDVFLSVGHDEYWSQGRRDAVEAARGDGVHLAFFSANEIYWKTRWENDSAGNAYRTQVTFKEGSAAPSGSAEHRNCYNNYSCDPSDIWTGLWREVHLNPATPSIDPNPENSLSGQISWRYYQGVLTVPGEYASMRFWRNTAVASLAPEGEVTLTDGMLGYEVDPEYPEFAEWYPEGRIKLSTTDFLGSDKHHLSLYRYGTGENSALVFGAGTVQWSWGLDTEHDRTGGPASPIVQQATVNLFADMGVQPTMLQAGLVAASASTDFDAPTATIAAPVEGSTVQLGLVTISGTATDSGGGVVAGVEVSVDNGATWRVASGRENWTYAWNPSALGATTILARAVDDSANLETPGTSVNVTVVARTCPCSLWETSSTPTVTNGYDNQPVEVGVKFQSAEAGYITALRFYKNSQNTGANVGNLWSSTGTLLATANFVGESASGWQEVTLASPVAIDANTTYVASYFAPSGRYVYTQDAFDNPHTNLPLTAPSSTAVGGNGVYRYDTSGLPTTTFRASNYWVDVVFATDVGQDTTAPTILGLAPAENATGVLVGAAVEATFNEPLNPTTASGATFTLSAPGDVPVAATVSYVAATRTARLVPDTALAHSTTYTARLVGGASGIADVAGNPLAADRVWTFTTSAPPPPPPDEGPGGPILVISSADNPFSRYYAEILRAEGLNAFTARDISLVDATFLADYRVAILGEMTLNAGQVTMLTDWVNGGGRLIAMRPDPALNTLLGLSPDGADLAEGYFQVNTATAPGAGIVGVTLQYHGAARRYALNGATAVATLYSDATTATTNPAVTLRTVGSGQVAAFAFDLAKSVVYTRQGNPAWATDERDGIAPIRSDDKFFGNKTGDSQPDWVDMNKIAIPQADEAQRLLANLMTHMTAEQLPLPRFWYFPRDEKAAVVMTHDDHVTESGGNIVARLDSYLAANPGGCSLADWSCIGSTTYAFVTTQVSDAQVQAYTAQGQEFVVHVNTGCGDFTPTTLRDFYTSQLGSFANAYPSAGPAKTQRTHCIAFSDWDSQPIVQLENGIRLDTNYYFWPPAWVQNTPGLFTGSGMAMRFAKLDGTMIDVYQAATQMPDESGQIYPFTIDTLLDRAIGTEGYYGFFVNNLHTDGSASPPGGGTGANAAAAATIVSAQARGVPIISAGQLLTWLDGRNGSSFANLAYNSGTQTLDFTVNVGAGANGLTGMVPVRSGTKTLQTMTRAGNAVSFTVSTVKGVEYAHFAAAAGDYTVVYADDITPPTVTAVTPLDTATNVALGAVATATFSEPMLASTVVNGFMLRTTPGNVLVPASVTYGGGVATLTPSAPLSPGTTYTARLETSVTDLASLALAAPYEWSFATSSSAYNCPCTIYGNTGGTAAFNDSGAYDLGVKFRSSADGYIYGIRFYRGETEGGPFVGKLWSSSGTLLASTANHTVSTAGWQEVLFAQPVAITANTTYVASYFTPTGRYSHTGSSFASDVSNPPLVALATGGADGPNGVFMPDGGFPNQGGGGSNYWVDVVFDTTLPTDTTPPTILTRVPAPGATAVAIGAQVTVEFSEPMNPATISGTTLELRDAGNALVNATVSYNGGTNTATLVPVGLLAPNMLHTVTVKGGASGVKDVAGNALVADVSWSFTTAADNCPCSIWTPAEGPSNTTAVEDDSPIEVGVKFQSESAGLITHLRYYRGAGDTDTHVGHLWSTANPTTPLATVTLTGSGTGWQEAALETPVAIQANTTYVASIFSSPAGYFVSTPNGLSAGKLTPPLRALAHSEGGNGVYKYGGGYPDSGTGSNYWVDVVFQYPDSTPPTISARAPAIGATDVPVGTNVTVQFSDAMQPSTINGATVRLRQQGAGSDVAAAVNYDSATRTSTLDPSADLLPETTYDVTVAGSVANFSGTPMGADATWSFTTAGVALMDDTVADFAAGTPAGCYVVEVGDGELLLSPSVGAEFSGTSIPAGWTSTAWGGGGTSTVGGGVATVDGARLATDAYFGPGRAIEFVATFGAATFQNAGFGQLLATGGEYWAMFGTANSSNTLYARTNTNNTVIDSIIPGSYIGSSHRYRIEWGASDIKFYIDGALVHTANVTIAAPVTMRPVISDFAGGGPVLTVDWLRMSPYTSPCSFTSRVFDRVVVVDWDALAYTGALNGGTAVFETRSGSDATPDDGGWSSWVAVGAGGALDVPDSRYIQYRVTLSSADAEQTPVIEDVTITGALRTAIAGTITYGDSTEAVTGATLTLAAQNTTSASGGAYSFGGLNGGAWTVTPTKLDDVELFAINAHDASLALRRSVNLVLLTDAAYAAADINGDNDVDANDAASILQVSVWLQTPEEAAGGADKVWRFVPASRSYPPAPDAPMTWDFQAVQAGDVSGNWPTFAGGASAAATVAARAAAFETVATFAVTATPAGANLYDLTFTLASADVPVESADLALIYDPTRLEIVSAGAAQGANLLAAANTSEPGSVRIGLAGVEPLAVGAPAATVQVRSAGDPLAALLHVAPFVNEARANMLPWRDDPFRLYLPAIERHAQQ